MQTHEDRQHAREWLKSLEEKANRMRADNLSNITAGGSGEQSEGEWQSNGVHVRKMPDDEHGILRISIGGGETPVPLNYCVFRGKHGDCVDLLRRALEAMENPGGSK